MTLESVPGSRETYFADLDNSGGPTVGDKRVGFRHLHAGDGAQVGTQYWVATLSEVGADGSPQSFDVDTLFVLDDGTLFASKTHDHSGEAVETPESVVIPGMTSWSVQGGTGVYADASGTLDLTIADNESAYAFDIACE